MPCAKIAFINTSVVFHLTGKKVSERVLPKKESLKLLKHLENRKYIPNQEFVNKINSVQNSWKAAVYNKYRRMTVAQLIARAGGPKRLNFPKTRSVMDHNFPPSLVSIMIEYLTELNMCIEYGMVDY